MQDIILEIKENIQLTGKMHLMRLESAALEEQRPGQFINIKLDGFYLRRPISVCDYDDGTVTIIYAAVGKGTEYMTTLKPGEKLSALAGLGNGYELSPSGPKPLLIGGGAGLPPLYLLAKKLRREMKEVIVVAGFNTGDEIFFRDEFASLGCSVHITTVDGSSGTKGFATDALPESFSYVYACGPVPMLKSVYDRTETSGQFSFEERMGCGFGACMGCSIKTAAGYKRVCKDGPVFKKEDIIWED